MPLLKIDLSLLLHTPQQRLPMLFNGQGRTTLKIAYFMGDLDPI